MTKLGAFIKQHEEDLRQKLRELISEVTVTVNISLQQITCDSIRADYALNIPCKWKQPFLFETDSMQLQLLCLRNSVTNDEVIHKTVDQLKKPTFWRKYPHVYMYIRAQLKI